MTKNQEIASTIMNQLGGSNRLNAMIGLKDVYAVENGLSFKMKCKGAKVNYVKIVLNSLDLYDMELGKIHGNSYKVIKSIENVYCDQMKEIIEKTSGLYLSL